MNSSLLTGRQRLALLWLGAVSPLFQRLPGILAQSGTAAVWLSPLLALLPLGLTGLVFHRFLRALPGEGPEQGLCRCPGPAGRGLALVYGLWAFVLCAAALRSGAERFCWAVFPQSGVTPFLLVMAALGLMGALGSLRALGRMGEVVLPFLLPGLALVLLPALGAAEPGNLPAWSSSSLPSAALGALAVTNTVSGALFAAFLPADTAGEPRGWAWVFGGLALLALVLCVATVGRLGVELAGELPYPFFVMLRDLRFLRLLERAEAMLCAQWVVTDFFLTAILMAAGGRCLALCFTGQDKARRWPTVIGAVPAVVLAWLGPEALWAALPMGNALLLFAVLPPVLLWGPARRRL